MTAQVLVLYFARGAEAAGLRSETLTLPAQLTSSLLWQELVLRHPRLDVLSDQVVLAVGQQYVELGEQTVTLSEGEEVAVITPDIILLMNSAKEVEEEEEEKKRNAKRRDENGGAEGAMEDGKGSDWLKLTCEPLSVDDATRLVGDEGCGAIAMFIGTTRDTFEGRRVIRLEYEAYEAMAQSELRKVCRGARDAWPGVRHICIHHRLGIVPVGEASVVIAISSPHRQDSLQAVQYCINTLKTTVPIWKKEVYEDDGSSWKENQECPWGRSKRT